MAGSGTNNECHLSLSLLFSLLYLLSNSIILPATTAAPTTGGGIELELIHRDSVHSPFYPGNITEAERVQRLVHLSSRGGAAAANTTGARAPLSYRSFLFLARVVVGTGRGSKTYLLVVDTASEFTWVHCLSSRSPYPGADPFDPQRSGTYLPVAGTDPVCLPPWTRNGNQCQYGVHYWNGIIMTGDVSRETFTFDSARRGWTEVLPKLLFGCTRSSHLPTDRMVAGVLALSWHHASFASQLAARFGMGRFSYCLAGVLFPINSAGSIRFGADIPTGGSMQRTRLVLPGLADYHVRLLGLSFNGRRMALPPGTFAAGVVIDSSLPFTRLNELVYERVVRMMREYFGRRGQQPMPGGRYGLELCYRLPVGFERNMPTMALVMEGAELALHWEQVFYKGTAADAGVFCLAMVRHAVMTVIGAHQQVNTRFVYDLPNRMLWFAREDCRLDSRQDN